MKEPLTITHLLSLPLGTSVCDMHNGLPILGNVEASFIPVSEETAMTLIRKVKPNYLHKMLCVVDTADHPSRGLHVLCAYTYDGHGWLVVFEEVQ